MNFFQPQWHILLPQLLPDWFVDLVKIYTPQSEGKYAAQLLWQRGLKNREELLSFLDFNEYQPTSYLAFGQEIKQAIKRIKKAIDVGEKVTIWGDFDADGVTATSVLWEGLGHFFVPHLQLDYYIPNRFKESHGLNKAGLEKLRVSGTTLIVTCDTGSTNLGEIDYANELGIDLIITDHHTLPDERPPVISIINPRYFASTHPLFSLSGVAVAYKLVEALYESLPQIPQQPLDTLLDLVAIGLIADLVELKGDCRYLAQKGIKQLEKQAKKGFRPGISHLLNSCQGNGDRPTDISFGIGPRINAISRIHGDAKFAVDLLTSKDKEYCKKLALDTELANTRRKELQKNVINEVKKKLANIDFSTTQVIVLDDPQWASGVLGLVAGQIAQEYGRPTILLTTVQEENLSQESIKLARGSARSINQIDLYELVSSQQDLLHRFGGHPYAAGLSLPVENINLFRESINQKLRQKITDINLLNMTIEVDLVVTVSQLGKDLFRELKLLEPCGMGNPVPKLLIQNCWFEKVKNYNAEDARSKKVQYIRTVFNILDRSVEEGFPGIWWGHYQEELPQNQPCDAVVELDYNPSNQKYQIRLISVRSSESFPLINQDNYDTISLIDWRNHQYLPEENRDYQLLENCPANWNELQKKYQKTLKQKETLALAYSHQENLNPQQVCQQLIGIVKYLTRTQKNVTREQLKEELQLIDSTLELGLNLLKKIGFKTTKKKNQLSFTKVTPKNNNYKEELEIFYEAIEEEKFQRQYFCQVPLTTLQDLLNHND
ncbi:single-stranded-DNA-specific exonuclease RecJ [Aphanothece sacrum]|uniref:Single-stranded-DNA-specific exonuclease RecJ n=1 Tax=Aphanothece sacrum FPU1 TaxID=1920663 RepID=A0A401IJI4_APHSA|nr:single-stranded-DNA-specific exonuclease RecJ [Aphanothece sacrum]GBF81271.1 single-stranded-DNA-specific exonuclease RecJ [Aphanothece sacrum FPU1]GBF83379.1 single-stranded-DNA-specific exonuclease RecJ [Aphanothece sacrum FPU3]